MGSASNMYLMEDEQGIIPRAIRAVFEKIRDIEVGNTGARYTVRAQFLEIYGEDIKDLLTNSDVGQVTIRENQQGHVYVAGGKEEVVTTAEDMLMLLEKGSLCRTTAATLMNGTSSRSHAIFTVLLEKQTSSPPLVLEVSHSSQQTLGGSDEESQPPVQNEVEIVRSKFHFVDLAGSERAKRTGASGVRLKEGIDINKGLLALGNVISALGDDEKRGKVHVPYRDSKLTRMLQDSLGGNSHTLMVCCVSPADSNMAESLNAVRYANRARNIKNTPVVNYGDRSSAVIAELRQKVASLAKQLVDARAEAGGTAKSVGSASRSMVAVGGRGGLRDAELELSVLQQQLAHSDAEVQRLTEELKWCKQISDEQADRMLQVSAEKEYLRMQLCDAAPQHAVSLDQANEAVDSQVSTIKDYMVQIGALQSELDAAQRRLTQQKPLQEQQREEEEEEKRRRNQSHGHKEPGGAGWTRDQWPRRRSLSIASDEDSDEEEDEEDEEGRVLGRPDLDDRVDSEGVNDEKAFEVGQRKMNAQVVALDHNIESKEDLLKQLSQKTQQYDLMRQFYEGKLAQMKERVNQKQIEHNKMAGELEELEGQKEKSAKQIDRQRELERRLASKEAELSTLRQKQRELSQLSKLKQTLEDQQQRLLCEVTGMKRQKVDVVKKMDAERKRWMQQIASTQREIQGMRKAARKDAQTIQRLDVARQQAEGTARRHMEEVASLRKAKRTLGAKHLNARASKGYDVNIEGKRYVRRAVRKASMSEEHGERMDREVLEVKRLEQRKQRLEEEHQSLQERTDIRAVLTIPEQGRAELDGSAGLGNDAEATLQELEEQLTNVRTELQFKEGRVKEMTELKEPKEEDQLIKIQETTNTLPQAHTWIRLLFNTLVSMKRTARQRKGQIQVMQEKLRAAQDEAEQTKVVLEQSKFDHDEHMMEVTRQHDMILTSLLEQTHLRRYMETQTGNSTEILRTSGGQPLQESEERLQRELVRVTGERDSNLRSQISQMQRNHTTLCQQYAELLRILEGERNAHRDKVDDNAYLNMELRNAKRKMAVLKEQLLAVQEGAHMAAASEKAKKLPPPKGAAAATVHSGGTLTSSMSPRLIPAVTPISGTMVRAEQAAEEVVLGLEEDRLARDPSLVFAADTLEAIMADCEIISEGKLPPSMQQQQRRPPSVRDAAVQDARTDERQEARPNSSIFDRLSNPDNFTGVQKHKTFRFNKKGAANRAQKRLAGRSRSQPPVQASAASGIIPGSEDESEISDGRRAPRPPQRDSVPARPASVSDPQNPPPPPPTLPAPTETHRGGAPAAPANPPHIGVHQAPTLAPEVTGVDVFRRLNSPSGFTGSFRGHKTTSTGGGSSPTRPPVQRRAGEQTNGEEGVDCFLAVKHPVGVSSRMTLLRTLTPAADPRFLYAHVRPLQTHEEVVTYSTDLGLTSCELENGDARESGGEDGNGNGGGAICGGGDCDSDKREGARGGDFEMASRF
mmetsp:Transcript_9181/g.22885  ORF Transcript_9181/g.22885 Transcript_9181/m.22885 type:complete len:1480 (+) Transcript_9181:632-5071(+)